MASVKLPDGSVREVPDGTTVRQVVDLAYALPPGQHTVVILTDRDPDALTVLRHSTAHVMAEAIQRIWPKALLAYGPALETGFYYDIALEQPISTSDFEKIEKEMAAIVAEDR